MIFTSAPTSDMTCLKRSVHKPLVALLLIVFISKSYLLADATEIVNRKIDRLIDLSSQLVKIVERIHIDGEPEVYTLKVDSLHKSNLAYLDATLNGKSLEVTANPSDESLFDVKLTGQNLATQPLIVTSVYTKLLIPVPSEIKQNERQLVRYDGFQTTLSPYLTKTITTRIKLPQGSRLESFTKATKMTTGSNKLTYGPFTSVQPNKAELLSVHYENNTPFVATRYLKREVEVSPWARSLNIMNEVKVQHVGAKLKGPFSRFDYQHDNVNGLNSVKTFVTEIPKTAHDIYFRDGIGNISTSNLRVDNSRGKILLGLRPRFPLFGGWGTDFYLGYKLPSSDYINEPVAGNNYRLSIPFADVMYDNMFIEEATVRIILPAGATNIEVRSSLNYERLVDDLNYSYLDVIGRPVVVLKKHNVVAQHLDNKPLVIRFNYSKLFMLQEPLLLLAAAVGTFILLSIYSRMTSQKSRKLKED